jgi:hypothetical protein
MRRRPFRAVDRPTNGFQAKGFDTGGVNTKRQTNEKKDKNNTVEKRQFFKNSNHASINFLSVMHPS